VSTKIVRRALVCLGYVNAFVAVFCGIIGLITRTDRLFADAAFGIILAFVALFLSNAEWS